jgi:Fe2+ or Zn2+ uptake regulation protein
MLSKFDAFEGKAAPARGTTTRRASGARRGSKREGIMEVLKAHPAGLTRGELLEKLKVKGDKSGEVSVSNALTALTKGNQVARKDGKYVAS